MTHEFNPALFSILGFEGIVCPPEFIQLTEKYPPAGIILFESNYQSPEQLSSLISGLKSGIGGSPIFCVDQEPGRVQRFKKDFPLSKQPSYYAKNLIDDEFRTWCSDSADLLADIGINLNLAPVLDLSPFSDGQPVLNERAFGDDPSIVSSFADILIREHKERGILTCGKHFPGLGSAKYDPHEQLSISDDSIEKFTSYHWKPFSDAIERGVNMIMTTHLKANDIDFENSATYSSKITARLRKDLGFNGTIITDDLIMAGAGDLKSIGESAARAIMAGHNLVIISRDITAQTDALEYMKNLYTQDSLFRRIANENEKAIQKLRSEIDHPNS